VRRAIAIGLGLLGGCTSSSSATVEPTEPPPSDVVRSTAATPAAAPAPGSTAGDLLGPGRFASWISYENYSSCSQSWNKYHSISSLVLDVRPDTTVVACRGRYLHDIGGGHGETPTEMLVREQQGFSGTWRRDGDWLDFALKVDDTACPSTRGYTNREPQDWHLRCKQPVAPDDANLPGPVLACEFADPTYTEGLSYAMHGVLPKGEWIILGPGDGVEVYATYGDFDGDSIQVQAASTPVFEDAWSGRREAEPKAPPPVRLVP
jgi:hypothetical protein